MSDKIIERTMSFKTSQEIIAGKKIIINYIEDSDLANAIEMTRQQIAKNKYREYNPKFIYGLLTNETA